MKISLSKKNKISEQILANLFENNPKLLFTSEIAHNLARDEEFIKKLLLDLHSKGLVNKITKNPQGINYLKRIRWKLSDKAYSVYKSKQDT